MEEENPVEIAQGLEDASGGDNMDVDGWQDKEEFEREQSMEEGDVGARVTKANNAEVDSDLEVEPSAKAPPGFHQTKELSRKEKEARKAEKKARHKAELKAKEAKKQSAA
ncbi:hypothetical protein BofuT4_P041000.1 [Botrytis cinerea T4]|nr:hypothetical protein BofuT4_P041000.1 [Botrytis cinerea T4]